MEWGTLYQDNYSKVFAFVFSICGDKFISEDITQEAFMKAYRNIDNFREECRIVVWLNKIAYHQLLDYKKKKINNEIIMQTEPIKDEAYQIDLSLHQQLEQKIMSECVQSKLNLLPENYRAAVFLDMHGYSNSEIANILECSLENAKILLHRGRKKLKEILGNDCGLYFDEFVWEMRLQVIPVW